MTKIDQRFPIGSVVWAPSARGEHRFRVVGHEGDQLVLKLPGSDAGVFTVDASHCFPSLQPPTTIEEF